MSPQRIHDLPPKWDGNAVEWQGWQSMPRYFICPPPPRPEVCPACGSAADSLTNLGHIQSPSGATIYARPRTYAQAAANQDAARNGKFLGTLHAIRCPDCRHDTVMDYGNDSNDGETWDLDDSDYGDKGSVVGA